MVTQWKDGDHPNCGEHPHLTWPVAMQCLRDRLRLRERKIIDETWGEALEDGSVPSTKLQDKIIAAVSASEQSTKEGS